MNLYQEELMDHFRNPRHKGILPTPDFATQIFNPSCGDAISFQGNIRFGNLTAVAFQGHGCVISQATASLLCEKVLNMPIAQIKNLTSEDILFLIKIPLGPTRLKCALLALEALQEGVK